jgi:hypothetical protein
MPRGTSILAVENSPNNPDALPPEDQFLWEHGAPRNPGEVAMAEILLSDEGGLETGGSRLFVGNLTIHSDASLNHPDFAWWPPSKPAGQGQTGPTGDLSVVGEVSVPRLVDQADWSLDL